jgi:hypothetical protein
MARLITRIADLCRHRAAEEQFLRRFSMMRMDREGDDDSGPGWYESSRELELGLQVLEDGEDLLAQWLEECRRFDIGRRTVIEA